MFEFAFAADLGITPLETGAATVPSAEGALPVAAFTPQSSIVPTQQFSPEVVEKFQAAMAKPLADNAILQQALETIVKPTIIETPETFTAPVVENKEVPKAFEVVVGEKPTVVVSEKPVVMDSEKPVIEVQTAVAPKISEPPVNSTAKEILAVAPETFTAVAVEKKEVPKAFEAVVGEKPTVMVGEKPVVMVGEKPTVVVSEKPVVMVSEKPVIEVQTAVTPKISEPPVNSTAHEQPIVKREVPVLVQENAKVPAKAETMVAETKTRVVEAKKIVETKESVFDAPQALAQGVAPEAILSQIEVRPVDVQPVASASVVAKVEAVSAAEVLVQAATAVADTMLVSPGLMRGEGEIVIQLKPEVLGGTELKVSVQSGTMTVEFAPTVEKIAALLTQNQGQLVEVLAERVVNYNIVVNVRPTHQKGMRYARA